MLKAKNDQFMKQKLFAMHKLTNLWEKCFLGALITQQELHPIVPLLFIIV